MTKAEKTRKYIIEKSAPVFNRKGYSGTSLADLMEITGLTKGSIYGNFTNKDEVAIAVYKHNVAVLSSKMDAALSDKQTSADKLKAFTDYYRNNWKTIFEKGGCPILNASVEADDNLPCLKKNVQASIKGLAEKISVIIEEGKQNEEFKKHKCSLDYAYIIMMTLEGGIMLSKISNDQHLLFIALDRIDRIIAKELKIH